MRFARALPILILFLGACATAPRAPEETLSAPVRPVTPPSKKPTSIDAELAEIQAKYTRGEIDATLEAADLFEKRHPKNKFLPAVQNIKGLCFLAKKNLTLALLNFKKATWGSENDRTHLPYYAFNLASAQFDSEMFEDTQKTLDKIDDTFLDRKTQIKVHYLRAKVAFKQGQSVTSVHELFKARQAAEDPLLSAQLGSTTAILGRQLEKSLEAIDDPAVLDALARQYETRVLADQVLFALGKHAEANRNVGQAETAYRTLIAKFPDSSFTPQAHDRLRNLTAEVPVDSNKIGVLLPMTGKFAKFGQQALRGIELAFNIYQQRRGGANFKLVVEDSGDTAEQAIEALNRLNYEQNVVAVIGPLLSKGVEAVTRRAQEIGLPLLSLTQQKGVDGDFIFYTAVTPKNQTLEIAKYAFDRMGLRRFAILAPANKFGEEFSHSFWDTVEALGGQVTAYETYDPKETDFRTQVGKMAGLFYGEARSGEVSDLEKKRKDDGITKKTRLTEKYYDLEPVIDFDAVFIPDDAKVVSQILPTFAYRDIDQVKFLGISAWNSPSLIERTGGDIIEGAVFVDSFFAKNPTSETKRLLSEFEEVFAYLPTSIEALSYDASRILIASLDKIKESSGRSALKNDLQHVQDFPASTGRISYKDGVLYHQLQVLTVRHRQISLAQ